MAEDPNQESESSLPKLLAALAAGARSVHGLPLEDDFSYESSFPEFSKALGETQEELLQALSLALQYTSSDEDAEGLLDPESFRDIQDPMLWDACADACEDLIEQVEASLKVDGSIVQDENALAVSTLSNLAGRARIMGKSTLGRLAASTVDMEKPQITYSIDTTLINDPAEPFIPKVHPDKPFSVTPLDLSLRPGHGLESRHGPLRPNVKLPANVVAPSEYVPHIYEKEITSFEYRSWQLEATKPKGEIPIPATLDATWVDTVEGLQELTRTLEGVREVAVDLEHHSFRSFAGLLCLMQISFRDTEYNNEMKNYLVDVFPLWNDITTHLAPMFANPDIVKVMHGADSDVTWLQRDFGIYIVNLFDTGRAARALSLSSAGLAFALQKYVNVQADKTHQLSDWRQRPLPDAMRQYAISDTHYLLDIYDQMKWDLEHSKNASVEHVLDTSRKICLIRYAKEPFLPEGYKSLTRQRANRKQRTELNAQQEQVLERLWEWRDQTARSSDESPVYVCSNAVLVRISLSCPGTVTALQALLNPIPPLVLHYATTITQIVRKVRASTPVATVASPTDIEVAERLRQQPAVGAPSSAFSKPTGRVVDDRMRSAGVLSPVLGTEALYKQAGWTTPLGGSNQEEVESRRLFMRRMLEEQDVVEAVASTTEDEDCSDAALDSFGDSSSFSKPRNLLAVNRANKDYRAQQETSHSLGMGRVVKDSSSGNYGRAQSSDGMGAARSAREHSQSPVPNLSVEAESKAAQQTAALIRGDISQKEDFLGLISQTLDLDEEDLDADEDAQQGAGGRGGGAKGAGNGDGDDEEEFVIPRSMREIYKISNRNRRNKKVSSPTLDYPSQPSDEVEKESLEKAEKLLKERGLDGRGYFDDLSSSVSMSKRQRTKSDGNDHDDTREPGSGDSSFDATREDDLAFMQDIGWIKNKEDVDNLLMDGKGATRSVAETPVDEIDRDSSSPSKSGGRESKTPTTFDYNAVGAIGAYNPQLGQAANPFFSGASLVGGPLAQGAMTGNSNVSKSKNKGVTTKGGKQNRRQERPEKRDGKTHAYRKR